MQDLGKAAKHIVAGYLIVLITALLLGALFGCAAGPSYRGDPVAAQCEYEADIAIQGIGNPLYAGVRKAELMQKCMAARGRG